MNALLRSQRKIAADSTFRGVFLSYGPNVYAQRAIRQEKRRQQEHPRRGVEQEIVDEQLSEDPENGCLNP